MFTGESKHLRVGSRSKAAEEYPDKQQNKIVTVPGEQHAGQHPQHAAKHNQVFAIAFFIRAPGQKLTHQNADHGATGKKEPDHAGTGMDFIRQKKAKRWRLQRTGDTRQKCDKQERRRR